MKFLLTLTALCVTSLSSRPQSLTEQGIIEAIISESNNTITIELPQSLLTDIVPEVKEEAEPEIVEDSPKTVDSSNAERPSKKVVTRTNGFRIQIFIDGRNQNTLRARARARAKKIISKFPKYKPQVYSYSDAPNYCTSIGNFLTRAEAEKELTLLMRAFPEFAGEMRVVPSEVFITK